MVATDFIGTDRARVKRRRRRGRNRPAAPVRALAERDTPWAIAAALLLTTATVGLAFHDGGYFGGATAVTGGVALVVLLARVLVVRSPLRGLTPAGLVAAAALVGLCGWTIASGSWSDAPGRALVEAGRTMTYATVFLLFATLRDGTRSARLVLRAAGAGLGVVVAAALAARLAPDVLDVARAQQDTRLAWPLGYWNGLGLAAAVTALIGIALASDTAERAVVRTIAAGLVPLGATALYLTLSRGAIAAAGLALVALVLLRRGPALVALVTAGLPGAAAVALAARSERLTAPDLTAAATVAQGHRLAAVLALAVCAAVVLQLPATWLTGRWHAPRWYTRDVRRAAWASATVVVVAGALVAGAPGAASRLWTGVTASGFSAGVGDQRDRLSSADSNGRADQWRVAGAQFRSAPLTGTGAGTYALVWARERPLDLNARDAHSLPLETAGELGLVGLLLLGAALLVPAAALVRRLLRRGVDPVWQAAGALVLLWLVHASVDWDWELPAVSVWLFALLGAACARGNWLGRFPLPARAAAAVLLLAALVLPLRVGASQRDLTAALAAFRSGDCARTVDRALAAAGHAPGRAEPFELLAYCDVRLGKPELARQAAAAALTRDPGNWQLHYAQALVVGSTGGDPRPALRAALAANPRRTEPAALLAAVGTGERARWRTLSRRAPLPLN